MTDRQYSTSRPDAFHPFDLFGSLRPSNRSPSQQTDKMTSSQSTTPHKASTPAKSFDTSTLMSPPELPRYESFASRTASAPVKTLDSITVSDMRRSTGPMPPLSPPISPAARAVDRASRELSPTMPTKDPILYPNHETSASPPQQPLFSREDAETRSIVDSHLVARSSSQTSLPARDEYELMLYFQSHVMQKYKENPKGWLKRERAQLLADRKAGARHNQFKVHPILYSKPQPLRPIAQRVVKPAPKPHHRTITVAAPRPIRANPPALATTTTPRQPTVRVRKTSPTPDPASRRVVAPNREDKDFHLLPDYCPPASSLPGKANSLKVDWKGAPIDLSTDPQKNLLHPDEVMLAANLRLDCATYLTSKRRMFVRRLECARIGKEFRKTDAQQACKIDVNKASKLWTAFDKVGWLEKHWMARFL